MPGPGLPGFPEGDSTQTYKENFQTQRKKFQTKPTNGSFTNELSENFGYGDANIDTRTIKKQMTIRINGEVYGQDKCPDIIDIKDPPGEISANGNMVLGISKAMGVGVVKAS